MTGYYFTHEVLMFHHLGGHSVHKGSCNTPIRAVSRLRKPNRVTQGNVYLQSCLNPVAGNGKHTPSGSDTK